MTNAIETPSFVNAPFLVAVTGYMDLSPDDVPGLNQRLRTLFRFLRHGASSADLKQLVEDLVPDSGQHALRHVYRAALAEWTGLDDETPIVVLTNLAPGADTLVAQLVLTEFANENIHVRCPLPFPVEVYLGASTFVREKEGVPDPRNRDRQQDFLKVLEAMQVVPSGLSDQADGKAQLPGEIAEALQNIPRERLFPVLLRGDAQLTPDELSAKWLVDRDNRERRNLRYYTAGEYLTVTAHLLVAIWNGEREASRAGTSAVVEARLTGPEYGLLPAASSISFPHGGPVWHLFARRPGANSATASDQCAAMQKTTLPPPPLRILHPYLLASGECSQAPLIAAGQSTDGALQTDRLRMLASIAESLRAFHAFKVDKPRGRSQEYERGLAEATSSDPPFHSALAVASPEFAAGLRQVSDIRCRAADLAPLWQDKAKRTLVNLFWLTFSAAVLLHCFSHWVPHASGAATSNQVPESKAETQHHGAREPVAMVQLVCGWLALSLGAIAFVYFGVQRSRKLEEKGHDARAIAEGLRVQFYWNLAGLGSSVSANYLSRHRSEMDWIRGVIRSTSMPYEKWTDWFRRLPDALKIRALRVVQFGWVESQLAYFRKTSHREEHRLHLWHKLGGVAAIAGLATFLQLISGESWRPLSNAVAMLCNGWVWLGLLVATGLISLVRGLRVQALADSPGHAEAVFPELWHVIQESRNRFKKKPPVTTWKNRIARAASWLAEMPRLAPLVLFELVGIFVPSAQDSANKRTRLSMRLFGGVVGVAAHLPLALLVSCAASGLGRAIIDWAHTPPINWLPSPPSELHWGIIAGGILLLAGALSVAWAEKNLHSEQAYQYNTMATLFHVASLRLDRELAALQASVDAGRPVERDESLRRVQALLFDLGKEALDENAEWLLLHRARPLEPVMAG